MVPTVATTLFLLALASSSTAIPCPTPQRPCVDFLIPVAVDTINQEFEAPQVNSNADAVNAILSIEAWNAPNVTERIKGDIHVQQTFSISARLCVPENGKKKDTLQIATHGGGFSKSYWDPEVKPEKYSYVDAALNAGYSILIYDRLGTGQSEKPDAYSIVQGPPQIEILNQLTVLARSGKLGSSLSKNQHLTVPNFKKIVVIGHSIGSIITSGLLTRHPSAADGAVLTGFLLSSERVTTPPRGLGLARSSENKRFNKYPNGYVVQGSQNDIQHDFFREGNFELDVLAYAESVKDTNTVGELIGLPLITAVPAAEYSGPLFFPNAEYDSQICGGYCEGTYNVDVMKTSLYPKAKQVQVNIQPGSGHGLTLHTNATGHFKVIMNYLDDNGL
ncbi:alpha/beta-hydrolase [Lipomyces kononenkoae]